MTWRNDKNYDHIESSTSIIEGEKKNKACTHNPCEQYGHNTREPKTFRKHVPNMSTMSLKKRFTKKTLLWQKLGHRLLTRNMGKEQTDSIPSSEGCKEDVHKNDIKKGHNMIRLSSRILINC